MRAAPSGVAACLALLAACATGRPSPAPEASRSGSPPAASAEASPFRPGARSLFAGCVGRMQGRGRAYSCGDVEAWIVDMGAVDPAEALRVGASGLRSMIGEPPGAQDAELTLAGRQWPAARMSVCNDAKPPRCDAGHVVAIAAPQGSGSWLLGCTAREGAAAGRARCQQVLDYFAREGTPEGLPLPPPGSQREPPRLLSRTLAVPEGCRVQEASAMTGNLECKDSSFGWIVSPVQTPQEMDADFERFLADLENEGVLHETRRMPCTIEHTPGHCALLEGALKEGRARFYLGIAKVGDGTVRVICSMVGPVEPFPPVCNGALAVP